ncbi:MAG: peptidoglycan DD-metalloendopeptidase family protein [Nitrospiraceae bacterium]|nr:peptidoglycan DD-metalloendopeptidase family protein [Nitrospiraceae bacterium]
MKQKRGCLASPLYLVIFFVVCFFPTVIFGQGIKAGSIPISIHMEPEKISLGGIALVRIEIRDHIKGLDLKFLGREIPCRPKPTGREYSALIGAGLGCRPGIHVLSIRWQGHDGPGVYPYRVQVVTRKFPEERLTVPERMVRFSPKVLKRVLDDQRAINRICDRVSTGFYWQRPFIWPVHSKIVSPFGVRRILNGRPRSPHSGIDLRARKGTPVLASNYGRVALVRDCYLCGKTIVLDHGEGLYTLYVHLMSCRVREGQKIRRGEIIGLSGASGRATGPHLHWGVSLFGERLDPVKLMALLGKGYDE